MSEKSYQIVEFRAFSITHIQMVTFLGKDVKLE